MKPEEASRTLDATLARMGIAQTALLGVSATMARPSATLARPQGSASGGATLPRLSFDATPRSAPSPNGSAPDADLVAQSELGRGGMGVVHLAEQRSLERQVAVKTALAAEATSRAALVREARIMGSLEHPNLVPVHALGVDGAGAPILVMKRIEGVLWRELLEDGNHASWTPLVAGHGDRLRANVEILSHVCRALSFAHDRGVIHRDLKPENVMIGRFGEVYVLDWGLALRLSERESEPAAIVGTPGYLAPEMALGDPRTVDARTDVYLLGGALYRVLTGQMPHEAATPMGALAMALTGETPPIPDDAPAELAELAKHAMALAPGDRVASAEAFRERLARFLASREIERAVSEARVALVRARDAIAQDGPASLDAFRALIEARVTFVMAHRARPEDPAIRADLDRCITHLVERELALRSPIGATTLLSELGTPSAALESRIDALERELAAERAAAQGLLEVRRAADTSLGFSALRAGTRAVAAVLVAGLAWMAWLDAAGREFPLPWSLAISVAAMLASLLAVFLGRRTAFANEASTTQTAFAVILITAVAVLQGITYALGGSMSDAMTFTATAVAGMFAVWCLVPDKRDSWPNIVVCLAAAATSFAFPRWAGPAGSIAGLFVLAMGHRLAGLRAERSRAAQPVPPGAAR